MQQINYKKVSVFVPVYNEESILLKNIEKLYNHLIYNKTLFELFIVDDGSKDNSSTIGQELSKTYEQIKYLRYNNGPSRRENLGKSFFLASGDIVSFMDADLSTDLKYFDELIGSISEGYDISIGSRLMNRSVVERSVWRKISSNFAMFFLRIFFGSGVRDHQCGFKAFKKEVILKILKDMGEESLLKRNYFWDAEILIRAQKYKHKIKEIPVEWKAGEKSTFNFFRNLTVVPYVLKFFLFYFK